MEKQIAYIGLDIGGTKCASTLGVFNSQVPDIIDKKYFLTERNTPDEIMAEFDFFIDQKLNDYQIKGIGISCGGPLDSKNGIVMSPPSLPLWDNIKVVEHFKAKYGIDTYLQNDANACAVAEWKFGAGKNLENVIFLTFGTGLGAGLILNGKLYSGTNDNAGEIGHVRLTEKGPLGYFKKGSCEGYCSGSGMARLAKIMAKDKKLAQSYQEFIDCVGEENLSAKTMAEFARKGNLFCNQVYKKSGRMLGRTLSILVDVLNPQAIILGGVYMRTHDLLYPHAKAVMQKECLGLSLQKVEVLPAMLGENIGDFAALSIAKGDF